MDISGDYIYMDEVKAAIERLEGYHPEQRIVADYVREPAEGFDYDLDHLIQAAFNS